MCRFARTYILCIIALHAVGGQSEEQFRRESQANECSSSADYEEEESDLLRVSLLQTRLQLKDTAPVPNVADMQPCRVWAFAAWTKDYCGPTCYNIDGFGGAALAFNNYTCMCYQSPYGACADSYIFGVKNPGPYAVNSGRQTLVDTAKSAEDCHALCTNPHRNHGLKVPKSCFEPTSQRCLCGGSHVWVSYNGEVSCSTGAWEAYPH